MVRVRSLAKRMGRVDGRVKGFGRQQVGSAALVETEVGPI